MISLKSLPDTFLPTIKKYRFPIIIGTAGLMFLVYGLIVLLTSSSKDSDIQFQAAPATAKNETKETLVIDVSGAVVNPGVYTISSDSRLQDALIKSGGLSEAADRNWVAKNINLAAKLSDGGKIYIPFQGENSAHSSLPASVSLGQASSTGIITGLININSASLEELDSLPGIGPVTASKIIQNRPYNSIDEILSKKAVTSKVFEKIKEKIKTY